MRRQLENQTVVLAFRAVRPDQRHDESGMAHSPPLQHFVHIGHINYTTWHFVVLRLYSDLALLGLPSDLCEETGALQVGPLPPDSAGPTLGVLTDLQFYRDVLDLTLPWEVQLYTVSVAERFWHRMDSSSAVVPLVPWPEDEVPPCRVWLGSKEEKANRVPAQKNQTKRRPPAAAQGEACKRRRVRGKQSDKAFDDRPADPADAGSDELGGIHVDALNPYAEADDEDASLGPNVLLDADEAAAEAAHVQIAAATAEVADLWENASNFSAGSGSHLSLDPLIEDEEDEADLGAKSLGLEADVEERVVAMAAGPSRLSRPGIFLEERGQTEDEPQSLAVPRVRAGAGEAPSAPSASSGPASAAGPRVLQERLDFQLGDYGILRFYKTTKALVALCGNRSHQDCKMERICRGHRSGSTSGVFGGQGRPIGLLTCWLRAHSEFATQQEHLRNFRHTQAARTEARAQFLEQEGAAAFSQRVECEQRDGEPPEPPKIR